MNERLRVFHLIKSLGRGGAEQLLVDTLRHADRSRFDYGYGYFLPWKDALVSELEAFGGEVRCFGARGPGEMLAATASVAAHLRRWRADVIHCHLPLAGVVGRLAGAAARVPVVYTEHNLQERYHRLTRWSNLATWRLQRRVIAVSADVARSAGAHAGHRVPVQVVLNGISTGRFAPDPAARAAMRHKLGIDEAAPVVGTVAVFRVQKKLDDWLRACRLVLDRHPSARFLLVGDGPERAALEELARELGLSDTTHFVGLQTSVREYLAVMDVFLISSVFEGLPLALLEAMASELAVVATSVGGIPEVVTPDHDGVLVETGDVAALARQTGDLLADPARRALLGAAAREQVVARFGTERMVTELQAIYRDAAGARS